MKRLLAILFTLALSGCLTYDSYGYRDDGYYEDRYFGGGRYYDTNPGYASSNSYWNYPDYVYWSDYYSVLWPVYRGYYDPFYTPGFYYGVTWYPRTYFGLSYSWYSWPYYQAYSPYRHSYWDGYYDHWDRRRGEVGRRVAHGYDANVSNPYLYGSARNEAEQLARRSGAAYRLGAAQPGLQYDPYAAQRTAATAREQLDGRYQRGESYAPGAGQAGGRGQMRRGEVQDVSGQALPSRARTYDRGAWQDPQSSPRRGAGWVSDTPADSQPRQREQRSSPYFRELGGAQVPISRQPELDRDRGGERGRVERESIESRSFDSERPELDRSRSRAQPYGYRSTPPAYAPAPRADVQRYQRSDSGMDTMQRSPAPSEGYQQRSAPRYESPQRFEAPSRSAPMDQSRPERSDSGSARDELRPSRDED